MIGFHQPGLIQIQTASTTYQGSIYGGQLTGSGELKTDEYVYSGEFVAGRRQGYGKIIYSATQKVYDGEWKDDKFHGFGILKDGDTTYEG